MKKLILIFITTSLLISCANNKKIVSVNKLDFNSVIIDTILQEKISIRAILIDDNKIWYAGNNGKYGYYDFKTNKVYKNNITKDSLQPEFRSIAKIKDAIFILNAGNPALLYRISKDDFKTELVYQEKDEKVFYDSMQFWNNNEGIAMGDPTKNCLSVIITRDGGMTWKKLLCNKSPKVENGEAAFAASNTNLIIKDNNTWMVSGGKKSRVFYSGDKGLTWQVYETPIVQGKEMTGAFTADFYDKNTGFIAGGDYEKPNQNFSNKAVTSNGGKSWDLIAENQGFGYTSCIQYIPNSNGKQLVCVGASGLYYSSDGGKNWKQFSDDKNLYTIRFIDNSTAIAAGRNKIIKIRFK